MAFLSIKRGKLVGLALGAQILLPALVHADVTDGCPYSHLPFEEAVRAHNEEVRERGLASRYKLTMMKIEPRRYLGKRTNSEGTEHRAAAFAAVKEVLGRNWEEYRVGGKYRIFGGDGINCFPLITSFPLWDLSTVAVRTCPASGGQRIVYSKR